MIIGRSASDIARERLAASDYVVVRCVELGLLEALDRWRAYREALREIARTNSAPAGFPAAPQKPWKE